MLTDPKLSSQVDALGNKFWTGHCEARAFAEVLNGWKIVSLDVHAKWVRLIRA